MSQAGSSTARMLVQIAVSVGLLGLLLFGVAGTLDWPQAWWFLALFALEMILGFAWLMRVNPEIMSARQRATGEGTKSWDIPILVIQLLALLAIPPLAAVELGRAGGLPLPVVWSILGNVLFAAGFGVMLWAQGVNRHFEPSVRIQKDRDHKVVQTGPYAMIRHPGYVAANSLAVGMALALGSVWALVPAAVVIVVFFVRTILEDQLLRDQLEGYAAYAGRVRYRWIPGVW